MKAKGKVAMALAVLFPVALGLGSIPAASAARGSIHIEVTVVEGPFLRFVDAGAQGLSPGDLVMEDQPASDPVDGSPVGRAISRIQIVRLFKGGDGIALLDSTIDLDGGTISIHGPVRLSELDGTASPHFAVVGGTGTYSFATGEAIIAHTKGDEAYTVSIDLTTT